jgi:GTP cyclohydrolase II
MRKLIGNHDAGTARPSPGGGTPGGGGTVKRQKVTRSGGASLAAVKATQDADRAGALAHHREVRLLAEAALPTRFGRFRTAAYQVAGEPNETLALVQGRPDRAPAPLVRLHSECLTGEVLGSLRCDCGAQLDAALAAIAASGDGVLLYLRQEGRGIGIVNKLRAYALQDRGLDTVEANLALGLPADARDYGGAAAVLQALGVRAVRLLTNNPAKVRALEHNGVRVLERVPIVVPPTEISLRYLTTKVQRMGHLLELEAAATLGRTTLTESAG